MRHPVWILNSSLLILFVTAITVLIAVRQRTPRWVSLEPTSYTEQTKEDVKIDIESIYNNDIFLTYHKQLPQPQQQSFVTPLPAPPQPLPIRIPQPEPLQFVEPLQLTLKGCIITGQDETNRAIIANNRTKEEKSFKIGDKIDDASVLRIFRNRTLLVRANGQEELLYLRKEDAKLGPEIHDAEQWDGIIKKVKDSTFIIDPQAFKEIIPSLAQLIEMLDITTVYKKGRSAGIRIGKVTSGSLGKELELTQGDVLLSVNGIPITTNKNRLEIYQAVLKVPLGETISVVGNRGGAEFHRNVVLNSLGKPYIAYDNENELPRVEPPEKTEEDIEAEKLELFRQKQTLAPTLDTIRKREKRSILKQIKSLEQHGAGSHPARFDL
ncbi:hypothetical protein JW872_01155 [Candidatus Babeliales bacterium]|nr:hypothetical protein [Candidatus Babeliales bacterium]